MTLIQRAQLQALISKRWLFKLICLAVAVPIVFGAFSPLMDAAREVYG